MRNRCLEKHAPFSGQSKDDESNRRVDRLITEIFRKEIEYHRRLESVRANYSEISEAQVAEVFKGVCHIETGLMNFKS